jgi:glycosyltransferase involved in cell wall biosynthesis
VNQDLNATHRRPGPVPVTILITTHNEEVNIEACLRSVQWAEEILVIDSGSTDATVALSRPLADDVLDHAYESPARQKNWAIPQAQLPWVLILDADERVTPALAEEITEMLAATPPLQGYWIYRRNTFLGREMRHGGWERDKVIRFFARDHARYKDVLVHEEMEVDGPVGVLKEKLMHHSVRSLADYGKKMDRYSDWWAEEKAGKGKHAGPGTILGHTVGRFIRMYLLRGGFRDGGHGLVLALLASFSVFQKYAKLWERDRREPEPD